jgi:trypsin
MVRTTGRSDAGRLAGSAGRWRLAGMLCVSTALVFCLALMPAALAQSTAWHSWSARPGNSVRLSFLRHVQAQNRRLGDHRSHAAIVGGSEAAIESAPWQVVIFGEFEGLQEICGGSILDMTHILTAGHCAFGPEGTPLSPSAFFVGAGTSNAFEPGATAEARLVAAVRVHPYFNYAFGPGTPDDVAVLTLASSLNESAAVQPIALAPTGSSQAEGSSASLTGFGREDPGTQPSGKFYALRFGVQYSRECGGEDDALFVCGSAPGGSACFGDSGGALTTTESTPALIGVADTVQAVSGNPCSDGALNGFVNVAAPEIRDFIEGSESPPSAPRGGGAVIRGVVVVGHSLTCEPGSWSNSPTFGYAFIDSATGAILQEGGSTTYTLPATEVGHKILCEVRATNAGGTGIGRTPGLGPVEEDKSSTGSSPSAPSVPAPVATQGVAGFQEVIPPPVPDAQLAGTAFEASSSGVVSVKVSCPAGESSCSGTVTLRTLGAVSADVAGAAKKRTAILTLATGSFTVAGGKVATVKLHLSAKARALLARSHLLRARAIVVAHDPAGATHTAQANVTVRASSPKRGKG